MRKQIIIFLIFVVLVSACSNQDSPAASADEEAGMKIFQANCSACHLTEGEQVLVGPSMEGLASRAGTTVSGMDAEDYLRESILEPAAHVNEGFTNVMPNIYSTVLSEDELDALMAYLLTFN